MHAHLNYIYIISKISNMYFKQSRSDMVQSKHQVLTVCTLMHVKWYCEHFTMRSIFLYGFIKNKSPGGLIKQMTTNQTCIVLF